MTKNASVACCPDSSYQGSFLKSRDPAIGNDNASREKKKKAPKNKMNGVSE